VRPARDELTPGEWAVLGLLDQRPAHGFALARAMAPGGEVGRVWSMRRAMVYSALVNLERRALIRPTATASSHSGPQRTILEITRSGAAVLNDWLVAPVRHVRDARSLLMLKLLFLNDRDEDTTPLLVGQQQVFRAQARQFASAVNNAAGYDHVLLLWRLHSTRAVIEFIDAMLPDSRTIAPMPGDDLLAIPQT
jgi:DNA-binding PadR family transcriptional regulator